ncbi:MAG TPA: holo-ACP synthase [Pirellulaceae bacterium]|nr:holo-ACP synthase [Pirellulaceae bacterium]
MTVLGIGTDLCECQRIERMIDKYHETFLDRVFTAEEIRYCGSHHLAAMHFAGRWAAKEAMLKAIGVGWAHGMTWRDLEVINVGGGQPIAQLHGGAHLACRQRGIGQVLLSISHTREMAMATAIAIAGGTGDSIVANSD